MKVEIIIKEMTPELIEDVSDIETNSFSHPWSRKSFEDELNNDNAVYFVATESNRGVGYVGGWIIADQYDVNNIAVLPQYRRCGIASKLLDNLIGYCRKKELTAITLEVREHNNTAKALYNSFGFKPIGFRKKYYSDTGEDAIIMSLEI